MLTVPEPADTVAPAVHAYPVTGKRGRPVKLRYRVRDDQGETTEQVSVYRGRSVVVTLGRNLRPTEDSVVYWFPWKAPKRKLAGRFCVRAADGAGNVSTSCASLKIR